jgi:radical SAM superfamily enzyme YgiQ (UPF0313 family)
LVNPLTPSSYWGFQLVNWFLGAKAAHIPLALITLAALFPRRWNIRLIDLNVERLRDKDILWADVVMLTGMIIQKESLEAVLKLCRDLGRPTVVGGPYVSSTPEAEELAAATSRVVGEAEDPRFLGRFVQDVESGKLASRYQAETRPTLRTSPVPRYDLLKHRAYVAMAAQVSRGCPHHCEFCDIQRLYGRRPRSKSPEQVTAELEAIYRTGFRGNIFFVDDNFIGDKASAAAVLEAILSWQVAHGYPFLFYTQADIRLAAEDDLVALMKKVGFYAVFVGLESPSAEALAETRKNQNVNVDVPAAVERLLQEGIFVYAGFIVGFDSDKADIFDRCFDFISGCRIDTAMVGMLNALPKTPLHERLAAEKRLRSEAAGDPCALANFEPKGMTLRELVAGYRRLVARLYSPGAYFARAAASIERWRPGRKRRARPREWLAALRSVVRQGIFSTYPWHYWRFILGTLVRMPTKIGRAIAMAISGHHYIVYTRIVVLPRLRAAERELAAG